MVCACLFQFDGFRGLARCGEDGAAVGFGEKDGPEADAAGGAVDEERGAEGELCGFEEGAPGCPHAHEDGAEGAPGEGGAREGEAAP